MMIESFYNVQKLNCSMSIDGDWYKQQWQNVSHIFITNFMGTVPGFHPVTQVKVIYDDNSLYVIFRVDDCYVRCREQVCNGPVSNDACVEFFFSPDNEKPQRYFNLEVNCGGTPLMRYNIIPRKEFITLEPELIKEIEIAHSLPAWVDPEITEPITWTVECRIPFTLLEKFSRVSLPKTGVNWRANFYKTAAQGTNPHWITWSLVQSSKPDFHLPAFFGALKFD